MRRSGVANVVHLEGKTYIQTNEFVITWDKGMDAPANFRWRRRIFAATTIVNGECGETNFRYYTLVGVRDICAENWQTPTSGGVNVAATRNSISRSCLNAYGAAIPGPPGDTILFPEIGSGSWIPKRDWKLWNEVRESGGYRWDTRAWRKSDDWKLLRNNRREISLIPLPFTVRMVNWENLLTPLR